MDRPGRFNSYLVGFVEGELQPIRDFVSAGEVKQHLPVQSPRPVGRPGPPSVRAKRTRAPSSVQNLPDGHFAIRSEGKVSSIFQHFNCFLPEMFAEQMTLKHGKNGDSLFTVRTWQLKGTRNGHKIPEILS